MNILYFDGETKTNAMSQIIKSKFKPLSNLRPISTAQELAEFLEPYTADNLILATVTLGKKEYIKMNDNELYKKIYNSIKFHFRGTPGWFLFVAEFTKSGILHFHGILTNEIYMDTFIGCFKKYGNRNTHFSSFQKVKNKINVINYIMKDQFDEYQDEDDFEIFKRGMKSQFPWITNISKV